MQTRMGVPRFCRLDYPPSIEAIFHEDNLPEEWSEFTQLNAEMALKCELITEKKEPLANS